MFSIVKWKKTVIHARISSMKDALVENRKAYHDFEILETYEAGIVLEGTEIKSLRNHGGNIRDAYVKRSIHNFPT